MENELNNTGAEATVQAGETETTETKLTFDELLKDKEYQSAFDKKIAQSLQTAKEKWNAEKEAEKTEAEKLAKMNAEEKHKYELQKEIDARIVAEKKLQAYELKSEALKIAKEEGVDISLLDFIDFSKETADTVKVKINEIKAIYKKAVEDGINESLKEKTPKTVLGETTTKNHVSRSSY